MDRHLFVTNFVSGKVEGPQKMRWWLRHSGFSSLYLQKWQSRKKHDGVLEKDHLRAMIEKSCVEWNGMVYHSQQYPFMTEHTKLEMALVDAAMCPDQRYSVDEVKRISDHLQENIERQLEHHKYVQSEFPIGTWKDLLFMHVKLFTESIRWYITPDRRKYAECEDRRLENTLGLAALSTEWF